MKDLNYYLNLSYEIIVRKIDEEDGGGYLARYKDFPYIMGDGDTEAEAIDDVKKAFKFVIETDLKEGKYIKEPVSNEAKERINITMPKSLIADIDRVTTNRSQFIAEAARAKLSTYY